MKRVGISMLRRVKSMCKGSEVKEAWVLEEVEE